MPPPTTDMVNESIVTQDAGNARWREFEDDEEVLERGLVRVYTPSGDCMVQVRALPLPPDIAQYLDDNHFLIKTLDQFMSSMMADRSRTDVEMEARLKHSTRLAIREFRETLGKMFDEAGKMWASFLDNIWAFGPKRIGPNILVNGVEGYERTSIWECLSQEKKESKVNIRNYDYSVVSGFQLATLTGPLCDEPMRGVCFVIEKWEVDLNKKLSNQSNIEHSKTRTTETDNNTKNSCAKDLEIQLSNVTIEHESAKSAEKTLCESPPISIRPTDYMRTTERTISVTSVTSDGGDDDDRWQDHVQGHLSGQLISMVKEACQKAFTTQPQRLMAAMYKCNIQASTEVLGRQLSLFLIVS